MEIEDRRINVYFMPEFIQKAHIDVRYYRDYAIVKDNKKYFVPINENYYFDTVKQAREFIDMICSLKGE